MTTDQREIRELVATWMNATKVKDTEKVLSLITDDVVFLVPGRAPMRKAEFAKGVAAQASGKAPSFDGASDVQEVTVVGDWAFMWTRLRVIATPPDGGPATTRSGHTLTILRKQDGRWLIARDANLLAPEIGTT